MLPEKDGARDAGVEDSQQRDFVASVIGSFDQTPQKDVNVADSRIRRSCLFLSSTILPFGDFLRQLSEVLM